MQEGIPYKTWAPNSSDGRINAAPSVADDGCDALERLKRAVGENAVLVFGERGCFMCHVVNRLLLGHGVKAAVYEVEDGREMGLVREIARVASDHRLQFPAVFIGGRFIGGLDRLISLHISGDLVPILKEGGALWL